MVKLTNSKKWDKTTFRNLSLATLKKRKKEAISAWHTQIFSKAGKTMSAKERENWINTGKSWQYIISDLDDYIREKTPKRYPKGTLGYWKQHK